MAIVRRTNKKSGRPKRNGHSCVGKLVDLALQVAACQPKDAQSGSE